MTGNAIRIIALSQSNPLKAIAEFVENSIDAHAKTITITRGKNMVRIICRSRTTGMACPATPTGCLISNTWLRTFAIQSNAD